MGEYTPLPGAPSECAVAPQLVDGTISVLALATAAGAAVALANEPGGGPPLIALVIPVGALGVVLGGSAYYGIRMRAACLAESKSASGR